jgi:hypothetical protein
MRSLFAPACHAFFEPLLECLISAVLFLSASCIESCRGQVFFREYWAEFDGRINNNTGEGERLRVNDAELSLHETFGKRAEAKANGLQLIQVPEDLFGLESAELYLELWGGHPGTENKRFILNGKETYALPDDGVQSGNCAYSYPVIPVKVEQMVNGLNAFQFACDRGKAFWGHFIIDNLSVRCVLKAEHPDLAANGLKDFSAGVRLDSGGILTDQTVVRLSYPKANENDILSVEYIGRYFGFDDNGNHLENDWHGYTHKRNTVNHIGGSDKPPFDVTWDTRMIPDQGKPMAVRGLVRLKNGFLYWTPVRDGLLFPRKRNRVMLFTCTDMPSPFWSRNKNGKKAVLLLPADLSGVESARLMVRIWDGGEGNVHEPFKINGHAYTITSGRATHDLVFTDVEVRKEHLEPGENTITLFSDTEHHGIELLLPGPCIVLRFR